MKSSVEAGFYPSAESIQEREGDTEAPAAAVT
jgi:hypothetical protein